MSNSVKYQKMLDDMVVARYMAVVDTRLDEVVLRWRMENDEADGAAHRPYNAWKSDHNYRIHADRDEDFVELIQEIRASSPWIENERDFFKDSISCKWDSTTGDSYLCYVLDMAGSPFCDESTGSTEWISGHHMRFGRVIVISDDQGFVYSEMLSDEEAAKNYMERAANLYDQWSNT